MNTPQNIRTVGIGGAAGDGIREAGLHLASMFHSLGYYTYLSFDYSSLIRGGHNFSRLSFSKEKIWSDHKNLDMLIAANAESVSLHEKELSKNSLVFIEEKHANDVKNATAQIIPIPLSAICDEIKARSVARTTVAIGAFSYAGGISFEKMKGLVLSAFQDVGGEINVSLAEKGFTFAEEHHISKWQEPIVLAERSDKAEVLDSNKAIAKGFLASGLKLYIAYPMTPSTSILHFLAKEAAARDDLQTIQPEDEISAINMAIGAAYAGKRTAVGTATGGFALMQEAMSFAGISESPVVVAVSQRQGPATGSPTNTSQADLLFTLHSGHGEFPRLLIAPGDTEESYYASAAAMDIAWKYQMPAIILVDKKLSESAETALLDPEKIVHCSPKTNSGDPVAYKRYQRQEDGISPLAFPGTPNAIIKLTSYEHAEDGISTENPEEVQSMHEKRAKKMETLIKDISKYETVKTYGNPGSDTVAIFWGSTKSSLLEASKSFTKQIKLVQILWMNPLDTERVKKELKNAKKIINIEMNAESQLASLLREKIGIVPDHKIVQHDSKPFDPEELADAINSLIK